MLFAAKSDDRFWCDIVFSKMQYMYLFFSEKVAKTFVWCVMALSILIQSSQFYVCLIADYSLKCWCYLQQRLTTDFGAILFFSKMQYIYFFLNNLQKTLIWCVMTLTIRIYQGQFKVILTGG